jgi:outer membrane protein OmpA-like peptidoglycan-associated protein
MNDSVLYFASDGHMGIGGLDIFESHLEAGAWTQPENLGYPLNSSADDFSLICDSTGINGYFSSSRNSNNDKLYSFIKHPPRLSLEVLVQDMQSKFPVGNARVIVSRDGKREQAYATSANGKVTIDLQPGFAYKLRCDHLEYYVMNAEVSTVGRKISEVLTEEIPLRKIQVDRPFVWQGISFKKKDFQLKQTSAEALTRLTILLKDNPRMEVEIGSFTDSRGADADNILLTQQRADWVMNYLVTQGIQSSRLKAKGYGETKLLNKCVNGLLCIEEEHEVNNRIEITVTNIRKDASLP